MHKFLKYIKLSIVLTLCWSTSIYAQVTFQPKSAEPDQVGIVYFEETAVDLFLHTGGLGLGMKFGTIETFYRTSFYSIDFSTMKHPKEVRQSNRVSLFSVLSRPYVYGKQNTFMTARASLGVKRYYSEKARRRGIVVGVNYQYGFSLGMLKPYYLELRSSDGVFGQAKSTRFSEEIRDDFLNRNLIDGYSGFFTGFTEMRFAPGVHVKGGLHFAWGAFEEYVRAIELGIMVDLFFRDIPIMIIEDNKPYFINLYLTLQLGRRR